MRDSEEMMVLVDTDDRIIGTGEKLETHRNGTLHRAFSVIVWSSAGAPSPPEASHPQISLRWIMDQCLLRSSRPKEDIETAARRQLEEEMGFTCKLSPLGTITYRAEFEGGMVEHEFVHVFRGL